MPEGFTALFTNLNGWALLAALAVFVIGGVFALVLRRFDIKDGVVFLTLLILPFAVYGVGSGYISELTAPGGWGAKFREVADQHIDPTPLGEEIEDIGVIDKGTISNLNDIRATLVPGKPLAMTLQLGRTGYYNAKAIATYARTLLTFDSNLTVVFVDLNHKFVASSNGASVMAALQGKDRGKELVEAVVDANLLKIEQLVGLAKSSAKPGFTNADALDTMLKEGVESLIAVDENGRPFGIVRRSDLVARLLVKLASG